MFVICLFSSYCNIEKAEKLKNSYVFHRVIGALFVANKHHIQSTSVALAAEMSETDLEEWRENVSFLYYFILSEMTFMS